MKSSICCIILIVFFLGQRKVIRNIRLESTELNHPGRVYKRHKANVGPYSRDSKPAPLEKMWEWGRDQGALLFQVHL